MPLLHRKAFVRQKPPEDLRPEEEVFLCKITHEIFRTYESNLRNGRLTVHIDQISELENEFFERTILCNSLVWSCALTGRAGLTYLEAVESERRAQQNLQNFPSALVVPLLQLVAASSHCRLTELCEDIYCYVKERFFVGETVDIVEHNGTRHTCEILQVDSPHSSAIGLRPTNGPGRQIEGDTIIISDSDDDNSSSAMKSPTAQVNGKKKKLLSPSVFKYKVRMIKDEDGTPFIVKAIQISRRKSTLSRERLKLFLKHHCEPKNGTIIVKSSTVTKYHLSEHTFSNVFPDEPPNFPFRSPSKGERRSSSGQGSSAAVERLRLQQQREEMDRARLKKEKEDLQEAKRREKEDKERMKEEQRKRFEEEKQKRKEEKERQKLEKEKEREKLKEEKKKYAERLKLWNKPRDDMECEDLKDLPSPVPVTTRLPAELFGDALMVLEFLRAFGEVFDLKDEFPDGVSLEVLEEALVGSDPEGPLCELLFFFLSAIFQALDEEQEEVTKDQAEDLTEALDDDSDVTRSAMSAVASLAAAWPQLHQGCSLKRLDLDSCTLTEILRLHILACGANAKFRFQKQGGFTLMDDPCVELRLTEPTLLKRLSCTAVYDLTSGEKLRILQTLVGKLLMLASSRDLIEDCVEEQRAARQEVREIRAEQHRREREEAAHRVRLRKEEKLREQEQRMKEKEEKLKAGLLTNNNTTVQQQNTEDDDEQNSTSPNYPKMTPTKEKATLPPTSDTKPLPSVPSSLTSEELEKEQERVRELQERIQKAAARTCLLPLGRDRLYRRYWLLPSTPALFVEEDSFGLTEDMLKPRPQPAEDTMYKMEDDEVIKGEPAEGSAGSHPAPVFACGSPLNRPNQWSFYGSMEEVDQLIDALNPRGHRESSLKEALLQERERLMQLLLKCDRNKYTHSDDPESSRSVPECTSLAETLMEVRLRDLLLDIEDRIHQGTLGTLKVMDRQVWRSAMEAGKYELLCCDVTENNVDAMDVEPSQQRGRDRLQELKSDVTSRSCGTSGSTTPHVINNSVQSLAQALTYIEQGIERRFLKAPLGEEDSKKDQKTKKNKKKDEDEASEDGSESGRVTKTVLERWRESLHSCSSLSQVFVHLSTLERSIIWSRSVLNARCRICRRKGDADNMLLCDGCDRGHHTHCLRPRLKFVPEGDWFCPDCRPKQRSSRVPSRHRSSLDEDEEEEEKVSDEGGNEESEEEETESEEEEEEMDEESEEEAPMSSKKGQAPPSKGRNQQSTPKNNNTATAGRNSASKSSGKKATPPQSKSSAAAGNKVPTRPGNRSSARLSQEVLAPSVSKKNSPTVSGSRKRPAADTAPPLKISRPVLTPASSSPSFSSRRSSGRNYGVHELSACEQLTVELVRHEDSWPFKKLVSKTQVPDYYDIIKQPIALSTIRERVNNCEYKSAGDFISDVELMFANCLQYNARHTNEAKAGNRLQKFFQSELSRLGLSEPNISPASKRTRLSN